ncbi:MAG: hypothetical protein ABL982_07005 [Vicinamibacterales bacterium]
MLKKMCAGCGVGLFCLLPLLPVEAQEVATLVLRDGQRPSGELIDLNARANQPWTNSGVTVKKGERLTFLTSGHIMIAANASSGAGGSRAVTNPHVRYPVPDAPVGALIARIDKRAPFAVGANTQPIVMPKNGRLYLGVNDDDFADNTGAYSVSVRR